MYNHMDDEELFLGENNPQYDCYRYMKQAVGHTNAGDWSCFVPETNIIWLHYVLRRLLEKTILATDITQGKHAPLLQNDLNCTSLFMLVSADKDV